MLFKGIVQKTLQGNPTGTAQLKGRIAASVCEEMEEFEKTVVDCISRLKTCVTDGETAIASECEQAEQVIESLKTNVAALEAKVKQKEDTIEKQNAASRRMEQTFSAKIVDLLNESKKKDESLESRGNEIKELKSKLDAQANQLIQLERALTQAKADIAGQAKRAEQIAANSKTMIAALEAQLKEAREIAREKDSIITGLEQSRTAIQDLENQIRTKEKTLADRDKEVRDLRSEVTTLMKGIKEMSSFFKRAEALASIHSEDTLVDVRPQPTSTVNSGGQLKPEAKPPRPDPIATLAFTSNGAGTQMNKEKPAGFHATPPAGALPLTAAQIISTLDPGKQAQAKPTDSQPVSLTATSSTTDPSREETVPRSFVDSMTRELSEAFGPMASLILRDHVKAVGESMEKFPKARLAELFDNLSKEIANEAIKISFREHLDKLHILEKTAA
jgi:predicted  nucleic acid-binding Zn-ribbon protein